jgi:BirA family biotin operon repressor/biotin-[acetyl-CoA-carboxylase] ligase
MDEAVRFIETNTSLRGDTGILAYEQLQGRGRRGRTWVSLGGNLHFSLITPFQVQSQHLAEFSFIAAVALREVIAKILGGETEVLCKWPNDILVKGQKIGGILLEKYEKYLDKSCWLIIGVGVNIVTYPQENVQLKATCLQSFSQRDFTPKKLAKMFYKTFCHWRTLWHKENFNVIRTEWMKWAAGLGQKVRLHLPNCTQPLEGRFCELDFDGAFVLETTGHTRVRIYAADVELLRI